MATSKYRPIFTLVGLNKIADAIRTDSKIELTSMALGDANNIDYTPSPADTGLKKELIRIPLRTIWYEEVTLTSNTILKFTSILEAGVLSSATIREAGIYDTDGDLIIIFRVKDIPVLNENAVASEIDFTSFITLASSDNVFIANTPPSGNFVTLTEYNGHVNNRNNPHDVTAEQAEAWYRYNSIKKGIGIQGQYNFVIGLIKLTSNSIGSPFNIENFNGTLMLNRFSGAIGASGNHMVNISLTGQRGTSLKYSYGLLSMSNHYRACSFTYKGKKYAGLALSGIALSNDIGLSNADIIAVKYIQTYNSTGASGNTIEDKKLDSIILQPFWNVNTNTVYDSEIYNSLKIMGDDSVEMTNGYFSGRASSGGVADSANQANKLATPRNITITHTSKAFDGTANISWTPLEIGFFTATPSTIPTRDGSGDIMARLFRSNYANQNTIGAGASITMRELADDSNNYMRSVTPAGFKTWLEANGLPTNVYYGTAVKGYAYASGFYVNGHLYATEDVYAYSDGRFKENLEEITDVRKKVEALTGYTYNYKDDRKRKRRRHVGLIAQDVQKVLPEAVTKKRDNKTGGYKFALAYGNLTALLVESNKEIYQEVDSLKKENIILSNKLYNIEKYLKDNNIIK